MKNIIYFADELNDIGGYDQLGILTHPYRIIMGGIPIIVYLAYAAKIGIEYLTAKELTTKTVIERAKVPTIIIISLEGIVIFYKIAMYVLHSSTRY